MIKLSDIRDTPRTLGDGSASTTEPVQVDSPELGRGHNDHDHFSVRSFTEGTPHERGASLVRVAGGRAGDRDPSGGNVAAGWSPFPSGRISVDANIIGHRGEFIEG